MFNEPFYQEDYDPDLPGFLEKVQEAVETEVDRRLHEEIADVDKLRERSKDYAASIAKAENEAREANREMQRMKWEMSRFKDECKQEVEKAKLSGFKDALGKWATADCAYVSEWEERSVRCPICDGRQKIPIDAGGIKAYAPCPLCNVEGGGSSYNLPDRKFYEVNRISLQYNPACAKQLKDRVSIFTREYCHDYYLDGGNAFTEREPAQKYTESHNKAEEERVKKILDNTIKKKGLEKYLPKEDEHG